MNQTIKTSVTLPTETFRRAESLRIKTGKSRSSFYAAALERYLKAEEDREKEARYEAGYRDLPETPEEIADLKGFLTLSLQTLEKEDW